MRQALATIDILINLSFPALRTSRPDLLEPSRRRPVFKLIQSNSNHFKVKNCENHRRGTDAGAPLQELPRAAVGPRRDDLQISFAPLAASSIL
jgi:hypothetical protein